MASCTTPTFGSSSCPQVRLTVTQQSSSATQVVLSWKLEYVAHGYPFYTSVSKSYKAVVAGATVASGSYDINGKTGTSTIASGTKTINKTTSAQTISFSCSMAFNAYWGSTYGGTKSASGSISVAAKSSYTITYNANGGSGAPGKQTKWAGTNVTLSSTKPTRTGYTFQGWATSSSGGVSYAAGATYSANASVTLYAVWKANTYTVTYNANGGSGAPGNQTKTYGVNLTLSSTKPTLNGYNFMGWGTSPSSTSVAYASGATYTANASITLYAVWSVAYKGPRVTNVSIDRSNSSGTLDDEGKYARVKFNWATDKAVKSIKIFWGPLGTTGDLPNSVTVSASGTSGSVTQVIGAGALSTEQQYQVAIAVQDEAQTYLSYTLPSSQYIIDVKSGGKGLAVGKVAELDNYFDVYWQSYFRQNVRMDGTLHLIKGSSEITIAPNGTNAINIKHPGSDVIFSDGVEAGNFSTPGYYYDKFGEEISNGLVASSLSLDPNTTTEHLILTNHANRPTSSPAYWYIMTFFQSTKSSGATRAQIAIPHNGVASMYHRQYYNGAWTSWRRHVNADEISTAVYSIGESSNPFGHLYKSGQHVTVAGCMQNFNRTASAGSWFTVHTLASSWYPKRTVIAPVSYGSQQTGNTSIRLLTNGQLQLYFPSGVTSINYTSFNFSYVLGV